MKRRGFTLIELLMAVSIVGLMSSLLLVGLSSQKTKGCDAFRKQEVRQLDTAIQLYYSNNSHVPDLAGTCAAQSSTQLTQTAASRCTAVANASAGTDQVSNWTLFLADISQYMAAPGGSCPNSGYTYVAPAAMKYVCSSANGGSCSTSDSELNRSYQIYSTMQAESTWGLSTFGSLFTPTETTASQSGAPTITAASYSGTTGVLTLQGTYFDATSNTVTLNKLTPPQTTTYTKPSSSNGTVISFSPTFAQGNYTVTVTTSFGTSNSGSFSMTFANGGQ